MAHTLAELTGPVYGSDAVRPLDNDLTRNAVVNGEPIGEQFLRPKEEVFNMGWTPAAIGTTQAELGPKLVKQYGIRDKYTLTSCSTCHR